MNPSSRASSSAWSAAAETPKTPSSVLTTPTSPRYGTSLKRTVRSPCSTVSQLPDSASHTEEAAEGSTYVKVNTFEGELTEAMGRTLLEAIARSLPGQPSLPSELELLPQSGKISGTEGYKAEAYLGQADLRDCLYAEYAGEGEESWEGFIVLPSAASSVWEALSGSWDSVEHGNVTVLFKEVPYRGLVGVVSTEAGVFGVSAADQAELLARLDGFIS